MTEQELFDRAVVGTRIQGFVLEGAYVDRDVDDKGRPCRCSIGHTSESPLGEWDDDDFSVGRLPKELARAIVRINDKSASFEGYFEKMSQLAVDRGIDDSSAWMEIAS